MTDLPATLEAELEQLGVVQISKHAPVAWPKPKPEAPESQGWRPSHPGEDPPF